MIVLTPLRKAPISLKAAIAQPKDEFVRDAAIQRFEYTYELAWKMLKRHLDESEGAATVDPLSRKDLFRLGGGVSSKTWKRGSPTTGRATKHRTLTTRTRRNRFMMWRGNLPGMRKSYCGNWNGAMLDVTPEQLRLTCEILRNRVPGLPVWAFGSRVTGNARKYSDLDLAVGGDKPLSLAVLAELENDFSESDLGFRVDVVDWASASEEFKVAVAGQRMEILPRDESSENEVSVKTNL